MTNEDILNKLIEQFENIELVDTLEIIGNLLVAKGSDYLSIPDDALSADKLITYIIDYHKRNGDSLPTAAVFQGLTILTWLEQNNGKVKVH
jgi:hypothetical protein